jgi:hypothetical protein
MMPIVDVIPGEQIRSAFRRAGDADRPLSGMEFGIHCPSCRETRLLRIERHISDGRGGEPISQFIIRLRCSVCRRLPGSINLPRSNPKREIIIFGPGAY